MIYKEPAGMRQYEVSSLLMTSCWELQTGHGGKSSNTTNQFLFSVEPTSKHLSAHRSAHALERPQKVIGPVERTCSL